MSTEISTKKSPVVSARLQNGTVDGGITADPTIVGTIKGDKSKHVKLFASFVETELKNFFDVSYALDKDGNFLLDLADLEKINGSILKDGEYTVHIQAQDKQGNVSPDCDVHFKLKRVLLAFINMMKLELILINTETNQSILTRLNQLDGYPMRTEHHTMLMLQHAIVTPDEKTIYVTSDSTESEPANLFTIQVNSVDWKAGKADLKILKILDLQPVNTKSEMPSVQQVDPSQPIPSWTQPARAQIHGPTFLSGTPYLYLTEWTSNKVRVLNRRTHELLNGEPFIFGKDSAQKHGINFNASGTRGVAVGYYYDQNDVGIYSVNKETGVPKFEGSIKLSSKDGNGAFCHYAFWLDERYALAGMMQLGPTSLTPAGEKILGPSVWLLDTTKREARPIIFPAKDADSDGVFRSPSDVGVVGKKLYVAEEDSLGATFGRDGYISVFDISDINKPKFLKRLKPGKELPANFAVAHVVSVVPDGRHIYVSSYFSNHLLKIDTQTDQVVKIYDRNDGLDMAHGEYLAGVYR